MNNAADVISVHFCRFLHVFSSNAVKGGHHGPHQSYDDRASNIRYVHITIRDFNY